MGRNILIFLRSESPWWYGTFPECGHAASVPRYRCSDKATFDSMRLLINIGISFAPRLLLIQA